MGVRAVSCFGFGDDETVVPYSLAADETCRIAEMVQYFRSQDALTRRLAVVDGGP